MNDEFKKHAASIANSSGFPLQLRVANVAESTGTWRVFLEEHPWKSDITGAEGFIDLVLIRNYSAMVIECKRVKEAKWVFLIPENPPSPKPRARPWESEYSDGEWYKFGWSYDQAFPLSYESQFCAIEGTGPGRKTLLERTAAELIESVEALALQEKEHVTGGNLFRRLYVPVIVTTAELVISSFDPKAISLKDGSLPKDSDFQHVPYIRFSKTLTTQYGTSHGRDILETHKQTIRTIFIVNAENIENFLNEWVCRRGF
jgi:hypothetical protein